MSAINRALWPVTPIQINQLCTLWLYMLKLCIRVGKGHRVINYNLQNIAMQKMYSYTIACNFMRMVRVMYVF